MFWKPFSSPSGKGSLEDVLERANSQLELAAKQDVPAKALRLAREAKLLLKDAEKIFHSKKVQDQALKDSIANAYHEHGKLLDELGYHDKAQKSRLKAEEWGYLNERDLHVKSSLPDFADGSIDRLTPDAAPEKLQNLPVAVIELPVVESHIQDMNPAEIKSSVRRPIFDRNVTAPATKYILPDIGERITSTPQLAYCLSLLRPSLVEGIDNAEFVWSQARINDLDEQERLQTMGTELVVAFIREDLKKPDVVAEVVSLATVLDKTDFRKLLQAFVNGIKKSLLLQIHLLDGLAQLIRNASPGFFDADDLVKILELLNARLKETHKQSAKNIYQLTLTISRVLDSMVENHVEGLSRESLHEPLSEYLKELQKSSNSYLIFQAAYASQALLYIRNDEPVLQAALRRTGKVVRGVSGMDYRVFKAV
ncbi:hypothetical protein BGZ49_001424 [Haplosporangium sp. Z 27]|nr:hypothetical protein BGZ49_001424 [Haplosporangium sp. Z 27]